MKSENVDWFEVVMDYGKRFPYVTFDCLFPDSVGFACTDVNICKMYKRSRYLHEGGWNYFQIDNNEFLHYDSKISNWEPVSDHVKLRLMTEGKEDLI